MIEKPNPKNDEKYVPQKEQKPSPAHNPRTGDIVVEPTKDRK